MSKRFLSISLCAGILAFASVGFAQTAEKPKALPFSPSDTLQANLGKHVGARVELLMTSGKSLTGTIQEVGATTVHLGAIEGKEFSDALIRIDQIGAVVIRVKS